MSTTGMLPPTSPQAAGFDPAAIGELIGFARDSGSAQLSVLVDGHVLVDEVFSDEAVDVYAVQKGILSLLTGIAVDRGLLGLDDPMHRHLPKGWTRLEPIAEGNLTIRHLLTMTTGMDDQLGPLGETGQSWRYNNTAYNYLKRVLCEITAHDLAGLSHEWLFDPLGMTLTRWVDRNARLPDGRSLTGMLSTASDLIRVGALVLGGGVFAGHTIVSRDFLAAMALPGSTENPAWGLLWWNNATPAFRVPMREEKVHDGPIIPAAPADLVAARGAGENHLGVSAAARLVVARTALPRPAGERPIPSERGIYERLMAAKTDHGSSR